MNKLLAEPQGHAAGALVLLNESVSNNQDTGEWNVAGSGKMWTNLRMPVGVVAEEDKAYIVDMATQNAKQVFSPQNVFCPYMQIIVPLSREVRPQPIN